VTTILGFDTSGPYCTAALLSDGRLVAEKTEEMGRGQAERLMPLLEEMLAGAGLAWADLDAIGVGVGPGNFTGIRISVSAARGLALALDIPAIGVSSFEAFALEQPRPCVSLVAAPREQVYVQEFGTETDQTPAFCRLDDIGDHLTQTAPSWVGAHAEECAGRFSGTAVSCKYPIAEAITRAAAARLGEPVTRPAPLYIKAADAAPPRDPAPVILP